VGIVDVYSKPTHCFSKDQDPEALAKLGAGTNAIIWPLPAVDEDEDIDELEHPDNQRLMRIGGSCSLKSKHLLNCTVLYRRRRIRSHSL
jgi:hypothetical protein